MSVDIRVSVGSWTLETEADGAMETMCYGSQQPEDVLADLTRAYEEAKQEILLHFERRDES